MRCVKTALFGRPHNLTPICLQELLKDSLRTCSLQSVHEVLLLNYVTVLEEACRPPESGLTSDQGNAWRKWLDAVRHMGGGYLPTARVWEATFAAVEDGTNSTEEKKRVLEEVYGRWRQKDAVGAMMAWANWLLAHGKGIEASRVIVEGGRGLNGTDSAELEKRWQEALGGRTNMLLDN
jgi:U3 small nucleolar RNA-associated protein 6